MKENATFNYSGSGWEGDKYDGNLDITDIAKALRKDFKKKFPACKFSIRTKRYAGGQSLDVSLMAGPWPAFKDDAGPRMVNEFSLEKSYDEYDGGLTPEAWGVMKYVVQAVNAFNFDDSDSMIDYFHTNFYTHLEVEQWDKPYKGGA